MAKKFRGPELIKEIDKALDKGMARFLVNTQSKLSASAPVDTGRLASSWMIGQNTPDRSSPPERKEPGPIVNTPFSGVITAKGNWYISSNLDYSDRACFNPKWAKGGRRGGAQWFTNIANNLNKDAERSFDYFLRQVK